MAADSLEWPTLALSHVEAEFEVVSPPELTDYLRDWSDRIDRALDPGGKA